jgi:hypothetical protein
MTPKRDLEDKAIDVAIVAWCFVLDIVFAGIQFALWVYGPVSSGLAYARCLVFHDIRRRQETFATYSDNCTKCGKRWTGVL